jgi:hypothetical protein
MAIATDLDAAASRAAAPAYGVFLSPRQHFDDD